MRLSQLRALHVRERPADPGRTTVALDHAVRDLRIDRRHLA